MIVSVTFGVDEFSTLCLGITSWRLISVAIENPTQVVFRCPGNGKEFIKLKKTFSDCAINYIRHCPPLRSIKSIHLKSDFWKDRVMTR